MKKILRLFLIVTTLFVSLNLTAQTNRRNSKKSVIYRANYQRIASNCNSHFSFEIREGTLWAWGWNVYSQLGDGTNIDRNSPVQIGKDSNWVSIATGYVHCVGLKSDGTIWAWGYNGDGRLGDGTTNSYKAPVQIGKDDRWISISCGYAHTLGIKSDGTLWAWGVNDHGQLGDGSSTNKKTPIQIGSDSRWTSISSGGNTSRALKSDGTLWAWGANNKGQLGNGTTLDSYSPVQIGKDNKWVITTTGWTHSLGIKSDGTLWACGLNDHGQLGDGTTTDRINPVQIGKSTKWVNISVGQWHSLGLMSDGTLWAWGQGVSGELGDSTTTDRHEPVKIGKDKTWVNVVAGRDHSLGIKADGTLWAWGDNANGQLGDGSNTYYITPYKIRTENKWLTLSGGQLYSAALKSNGTLWAWGENSYGQLGDSSNNQKSEPVQIGKEKAWINISAGGNHTLSLKADGTLWAWGKNLNGQLGDSSSTTRFSPVQIGNDDKWVSISAGTNFSVGLKSDGTLWAWGNNSFGQLGIGNNTDQNIPVQIGKETKWVSVSTGHSHVLALRCDGTLWAWGKNNFGQLGIGNTTDQNIPVQVGTNATWISISSGYYHSIALRSNGSIWTWGNNSFGQLGDATTTNRTDPYNISSDYSWVGISSGGFHSLGFKSNGSFWSWGYNGDGQLADGTTTNSTSPGKRGSFNNWCYLTAGGLHTLGVLADRKIFWAEGNNCYGQLGDSTKKKCNTPGSPVASGKTTCSGNNVLLSAMGVGKLSWYSSATGGNYLGEGENYLTPVLTKTTTFYVQDSLYKYSSTRTAVEVIVNPLPDVSALASDTSVCSGTKVILYGKGADSYKWSNGIMDSLSFSPMKTATYKVVGFDLNGCSDSSKITINVNTRPNVSAITSDTLVCEGVAITLSGLGAKTYKWDGGITNGQSFKTSATKTYTVIGTDGNNCSDTASVKITVNPLPKISINATQTIVCYGTSINLTGTGAIFYKWSGGIDNGVSFKPALSNRYTVTGIDANNCSDTASINIKVNPLPKITINASATMICSGNAVTLIASGADSYLWSDGKKGEKGVYFPSISTSYKVKGTDSNNCSDSASIGISVNAKPNVSANLNGKTITVNQSGATYQWLDCKNNFSPIFGETKQSFTATKNGSYAVTVILNDCSDTSECINVGPNGIDNNINNKNSLKVYPNPNNGKFTIQSLDGGTYSIVSELGQTVQNIELNLNNNNTIKIDSLSNGIYFIIGFNNSQVTKQRIIIYR